MSNITPHFGEVLLIAAVIFMIFGLGRLPQLSRSIARWTIPEARNQKPDK